MGTIRRSQDRQGRESSLYGVTVQVTKWESRKASGMGALRRMRRRIERAKVQEDCPCCEKTFAEVFEDMARAVAEGGPLVAYEFPCGCSKEMGEAAQECKAHVNRGERDEAERGSGAHSNLLEAGPGASGDGSDSRGSSGKKSLGGISSDVDIGSGAYRFEG